MDSKQKKGPPEGDHSQITSPNFRKCRAAVKDDATARFEHRGFSCTARWDDAGDIVCEWRPAVPTKRTNAGRGAIEAFNRWIAEVMQQLADVSDKTLIIDDPFADLRAFKPNGGCHD